MIKTGRTATMLTALMFSAGIMVLNNSTAFGQEHPEHPTKSKESSDHAKNSEHPEHPTEAFKVNIATMAKAINDYVDTDSKLKGGFFLVYDSESKSALQLTLTKVHEERLAQVGENLYFACSDFDDVSGKSFDLDFFMKKENDQLVVTEVMIHKQDGKARYSWVEKDGVWKRK